MSSRLMSNYGWVQNTSNLSTVRDTIDLVPDNGIRHSELREKIRISREAAGDLPARWTWDARCRIKAIHAIGLVKLERNIQGYELTDLGRRIKAAPKASTTRRGLRALSLEEIELFREGLLSNPPVIRVLSLLNNDRNDTHQGLSKYDIGQQLGFAGDVGFTHIDPYWVAKQGLSFNDKEGDADKWARTILSWLTQVGWATDHGSKEILGRPLKLFSCTAEINNILRYNAGRVKRNVPSEMLCSGHHAFPKLVQKRRILILKALEDSPKTINQLKDALHENEVEVSDTDCRFEILNLKNTGFQIAESAGYFKLEDKVVLDHAPFVAPEEGVPNEAETLIENLVVEYADTIPARLVDHLIRFGYDGDKNREFETAVAEFFRFIGYEAEYLGQGRGRVADVYTAPM